MKDRSSPSGATPHSAPSGAGTPETGAERNSARSSPADDGRGASGFWGLLKAVYSRFSGDHMTDHAAALTYYTLMSLFPALLVGVALFGLLGEASTVDRIAGYLARNGVDKTTVDAVHKSLQNGVNGGSAVSFALAGGVAAALYGASGAFGAAGRALNVVLRADEDRGFVRRKFTDIGSTLVVIVLALVAMVLVFLGGGVAEDLFGTIGLGSGAASAWNIARWPAAVAVAMVIYAFVFYAAPDNPNRPFRWISPGAVAGVLLWIAASAGFFFYVSNFGSYNKTYGTFAGAVILLVWLWLTNVALLFGAELNAELDERRSGAQDPDARVAVEARQALPGEG